MNVETLLSTLNSSPENLEFAEVMQVIDDNYRYTPTDFKCGDVQNIAGTNEGSCKILAFAKMHDVNAEDTPYLFGRFYRDDVVKNPNANDHANIRNFLTYGWAGVSFSTEPLHG